MRREVQYILVCIFLMFPGYGVFAQNQRADSLYAILKKQTRQDTAYVRLMFDYSAACYPAWSDSTFKYSDIAYGLAEKLDFPYGRMRGYNGFALKALKTNQFDSAKYFYRRALLIADKIKDQTYQMKIRSNIGVLYHSTGVPDSAKTYFLESLEIAKQIGDIKMQAKCLSDLGSSFGVQGDYLQAVRYLVQSLSIYEKAGSLFDIISTNIRLGNQYMKIRDIKKSRRQYLLAEQLNDSLKNERFRLEIMINTGLLFQEAVQNYDSARYYLQKGYNLARAMNIKESALVSVINLGNVYYCEKNYTKALEYYIEAYDSPLLKSRQHEQTAVLVNLGSVYMYLGRTSDAEKLLIEGESMARKNHFLEFRKIACESLSTLAFKGKKFEQAYKYLSVAYALSDTLSNQEMKNQIAEIHFQHELEKMETENQLLVNENKVKEQVIFRQQLIVAGSLIILLLIVILVLVLIRSGNKQRALNRKLDEQNHRLTELNSTKDKFFSIVAHDLKSPFNALMALLVELDEDYGDFDETSRKRIIRLLRESSFNTYNLLINLLDWARTQQERIVNQPENVHLTGIVEEVFATLKTRALLKSQSLINEVSPETIIYGDPRIIESLLINLVNNGIKFTPASGSVKVYTRLTGHIMQVCVEDSGIGIPEREIPNLFRIDSSYKRQGTEKEPGTGLGLILCKEYANILGGEITVKSAEGKGTMICFTVPAAGSGHAK